VGCGCVCGGRGCTARLPTRQGRCAPLRGRLRRSLTRGSLPGLGRVELRAGWCPARLDTATAVAGITLGTNPTYSIPSYEVHASQIVWAALMGPIAGVAAVLWVKTIARANALRPRRWGCPLYTSPTPRDS